MRQAGVAATTVLLLATLASAQAIPAARLAIFAAEEHGAADARDLAAIRAGLRSGDEETARAAARAIGRLRRPALATEVLPLLRSAVPEVRAEAAVASAQSLADTAASLAPRTSVVSALLARLDVEAEASVRGSICDALGRIPRLDGRQIALAEQALVKLAKSDFLDDRLGVARGLEGLMRRSDPPRTPSPETLDVLRSLVDWDSPVDTHAGRPDPLRDARVRRLAFDALATLRGIDTSIVSRAAHDPDSQMRWRAVEAASTAPALGAARRDVLVNALDDGAPLVRAAAVTGLNALEPGSERTCARALAVAHDASNAVAIAAIDVLAHCGSFQQSLALTAIAQDTAAVRVPRSWQRAAHAVLSLARSAPTMASPSVAALADVPIPAFRYYVALAAVATHDARTLQRLARDPDQRVAHAARTSPGGVSLAGDTVGREVGSPFPGIADSGSELVRLTNARVRVTIRDLGSFELALLTSEAPRTALRFAQLARAGAFDGTVMTGPAGTDVGLVSASSVLMSDLKPEAGRWPHVRGVVSLVSDPEGLHGARMFVNLVDSPRFDGAYTPFAQILNGAEVIDLLLEGDVIDRVEILTPS
jgi:peptidyl-prolyl cis-trans isomerase B (cyclophilin B)